MTLTVTTTLWTHWYGLLSGIIAHSLYIVLHSSPPKCFFVGPEPHGSFPFYGHTRCFALADVSARWMPYGMCQLLHLVDPQIGTSCMYEVVGLSSWYVQAGGKWSLLLRALVMRAGVRSFVGGSVTYLRGFSWPVQVSGPSVRSAMPHLVLLDACDPYGALVPLPLGITSTSEIWRATLATGDPRRPPYFTAD